ncbi:MAG: hypothetical protein KAG18_02315 [Sinobacterium sp.]|nr:hypothetical protein [Sinobacterium sp.]
MRTLAVIWAVAGVVALLMFALFRLSGHATSILGSELTGFQSLMLVFSCCFMAYSEGYKGFYLSFSPRFAARAKYIYLEGTTLEMLLAPFFCFGYFGTTRAKQVIAITLTLSLSLLVFFMHYVPQPWRGIIDAGVVVGLSIGIVSVFICVLQEFFSAGYKHDPQVLSLTTQKTK